MRQNWVENVQCLLGVLKVCESYPRFVTTVCVEIARKFDALSWIEGRRLRKRGIYTNIFKGKQPTFIPKLFISSALNTDYIQYTLYQPWGVLSCLGHWMLRQQQFEFYFIHNIMEFIQKRVVFKCGSNTTELMILWQYFSMIIQECSKMTKKNQFLTTYLFIFLLTLFWVTIAS